MLSVALLLTDTFSLPFFLIFALAGLTDMLDGFVARTTVTESELGARLDSIAEAGGRPKGALPDHLTA